MKSLAQLSSESPFRISKFPQKVLTRFLCGGGAQDTSPAEIAKRLVHIVPFLALVLR